MILALTSLELWLAIVVAVVFNAAVAHVHTRAIKELKTELLSYIVQIRDRQHASILATDERIEIVRQQSPEKKTQLQINATVTETLAVITNEPGHKALAQAAAEELSSHLVAEAENKQQSIHSHEAYR